MKKAQVDAFLKYLDNVQSGEYSLRAEEIQMLSAFDTDGIAGLSNQEITSIGARLNTFKNNIAAHVNADDGSLNTANSFDLDANGSTANDLAALQHILSGRTEPHTLATSIPTEVLEEVVRGIRNPASGIEMNSTEAGLTGVRTRGGYVIITDVNDTRESSLGTNHNIIIMGPDGELMSHIWGDPHVVENGGANTFHFGDDSTFILPDGTKIFMNTVPWNGQEGALVARGLVIDDGQSLFTTGQVTAGGRTISNTGMVNIPRNHADHAVLNNGALADRTSAVHSGVFAWSEAANDGVGGWAMQMSPGVFRDVKNEHFYTYLNNLGFNDQLEAGTVGVSREATIAALDGIAAAGLDEITRRSFSGTIVDSYLRLAQHAGTQTNINNFVSMLNRSASLETLETYSQAAQGLLPAAVKANFDAIIASNQTHHVLNGYTTLVKSNVNSELTAQYLSIVNNNSLTPLQKDGMTRAFVDLALEHPENIQDMIDLGLHPNSNDGLEAFHFAFFVNHFDPRPDAIAAFKAIRMAGMRAGNSLEHINTANRVTGAYMSYNANHSDGDFDGTNQVLTEFANRPNTTMAQLEQLLGLMNANRSATVVNNFIHLANNGVSESTINQYLDATQNNTGLANMINTAIVGGATASLPRLIESHNKVETLMLHESPAPSVRYAQLIGGILINNGLTDNRALDAFDSIVASPHANAVGNDVVSIVNSTTLNAAQKSETLKHVAELLTNGCNPTDIANYSRFIANANNPNDFFQGIIARSMVRQHATTSMIDSFIKLTHSASYMTQAHGFSNIFNKQPCENSVKEAWLEDYTNYAIAGDTARVDLLNSFVDLGYNQFVTRPFLGNSDNVRRGTEILNLTIAKDEKDRLLQNLLLLSETGAGAAVMDRYVQLAKNGAGLNTLNAYATVHARKNPAEINLLNNYISLNASDSFMADFARSIDEMPSIDPNVRTARLSNSLLALRDSQPHVFTTDMQGTFRSRASGAIVSAANNVIGSIIGSALPRLTSTGVAPCLVPNMLQSPEVMTRVQAELAKLNDPSVSDRDKFIAARVLEHVAFNGLDNINAAVTNITNDVNTQMRSLGLPVPGSTTLGGSTGGNPNPGTTGGSSGTSSTTPVNRSAALRLQRLNARLSSYIANKATITAQLASANLAESRRSILERRLATLDSRIEAIQTQLGASV